MAGIPRHYWDQRSGNYQLPLLPQLLPQLLLHLRIAPSLYLAARPYWGQGYLAPSSEGGRPEAGGLQAGMGAWGGGQVVPSLCPIPSA